MLQKPCLVARLLPTQRDAKRQERGYAWFSDLVLEQTPPQTQFCCSGWFRMEDSVFHTSANLMVVKSLLVPLFLSCHDKGKLPETACGTFKEEEFCTVYMH